ncbi:hypothetical protein Q3G72_024041 [Acer saccharum]|nr:hypothetical protein Q3G72_010371 [Acer saccharum]KAK1583468.1 hypothetical protein Q3G72_024041 [Acer saccharum]
MDKYSKIQTLVLMIALLFSFTNSWSLDGNASCERKYAVRFGDTCTAIAQMFKLSTVTFGNNNPNLNCNELIVGQKVCVSIRP